VICVHTPVLPFCAQDFLSQVSLPNSPGRGIVCERPEPACRSSRPRRGPGPLVLLCVLTVSPSRNDEPTMMTSLATVGVEWRADLPGLQIDLLDLADDGTDLHVDDAVGAEAGNGDAGLRVQRDQAVAGGHVDHAVVALAVGPVRKAAAGQLARGVDGAGRLPSPRAPRSAHRSSRRARRRSGACHPWRRWNALDHQRRAFELELGTGAEVVGLEPPRNLELVEIAAVDLIEWRVARAFDVGRVVRPLAVLCARESGACPESWAVIRGRRP